MAELKVSQRTRDAAERPLPCPNPWCVPSDDLPPTLHWTLSEASEAFVECASCGMMGPSVSPVIMEDDGEPVGTRDAEADAITAWNTRPAASPITDEAAATIRSATTDSDGQDIPDHVPVLVDAGDLRAILAALPLAPREGWQEIASAPKDGTVFIARNGDHPSFGSWPMVRRVRHVLEGGEFRCIDMGGWLQVLDIKPDYDDGTDTPETSAVPFSIAPDDLNTSVRYEWMPLPAALSRTGEVSRG